MKGSEGLIKIPVDTVVKKSSKDNENMREMLKKNNVIPNVESQLQQILKQTVNSSVNNCESQIRTNKGNMYCFTQKFEI